MSGRCKAGACWYGRGVTGSMGGKGDTIKMVADKIKAAGFTVVGSQEVSSVPDAPGLDIAFEAGKAMVQRIRK
ncbi:MAG: hypothetical protein WC586_02715 [Methanoregula sp.]